MPKAKKVGRPKLPKGEAKGRIVPVRFTGADIKAIEARAKSDGKTVSEWIRRAIMGRNVKRWYAYCPGDLHIILFDNHPLEQCQCPGCGSIVKVHGIGEGYVSKDEADKGLAYNKPLDEPNMATLPTRL
ncbi:MAG TPA: hypothetical protein VFK06_19455 [Candidatus Angelobacter sp.]|nr:hypothetical protein [Candidatus Angelobacter sp.]